MKATELIEQLAARVRLYGDRTVFVNGEVGEPLVSIEQETVYTSTPCGCAGDDVEGFVLKT